MNRTVTAIRSLAATLLLSLLCACGTTSTVPITGRKHRLMVDDAQVLSLSTQEYTKYMQTAKASTDANNTAMVKRVGQRLANAVETYLSQNGYANELQNFKWEFNLVQDKQANAFCMPGGKIVVYEGILPLTQTEAGLAIVLGHEIAHAVAKHSAEQMTKQQKAELGGQLLGGVLSATGVNTDLANQATTLYGLGSNLAQLKYSRNHESEADYMGLIFSSMAGYDPNEAIVFWQRMAQSSNSTTPAFLSTHPSDSKRIADIQKHLPEALRYYQASQGANAAAAATGTTAKKGSTTKKSTSAKKTTTTKQSTGYHF
ncbi:MAG: M48 family metallopeptidase [Bacteroidaceae bacterium]|nr:M48 family metallopeptidase [Bacteroidaceae bacterium]